MWETIAAMELEFYKNRHLRIQEIEERLEEINSEYLQFPHTFFDEDLGIVSVYSRSVEDSVIWKIEIEESLTRQRMRILERCTRIEQSLEQLSEDDQAIVRAGYLVNYYIEPEDKKLRRQQRKALFRFYRVNLERQEEEKKKRAARRRQSAVSKDTVRIE